MGKVVIRIPITLIKILGGNLTSIFAIIGMDLKVMITIFDQKTILLSIGNISVLF